MQSTTLRDKQSNNTLPPRISIFDKKGQANLSRFTKITNMPQKSEKVNIPTVRINQHKGA